MGDLLIRNLPDGLRQDLASAASASGQNLSDAAKEAIRVGLSQIAKLKTEPRQNAYDAITAAFGDSFPSDELHDAYVKDLEYARKSGFERPVAEFE